MSPLLWAALAAIFANLLVAGVAYGLTSAPSRHWAALMDWRKRTFTTAGDGCTCCSRWSVTVFCPSCEALRVLTPTATKAIEPETREKLRGIWEIEREHVVAFTPKHRAEHLYQKMRRTTGTVN